MRFSIGCTHVAATAALALAALAPRAPAQTPPASLEEEGSRAVAAPESGMVVVDGFLDGSQTGTGFGEDYKLGLPSGWAGRAPAPLLLAWHGYGAPPEQIFRDTEYPAECERRGWFLLAPRGLDDKSFGWPPAQRNVQRLLEHVVASYPIDPDRIYGVGWSMGAQSVLSLAARHRDPQGPALAAVAGIAGPYDLIETHLRESASVRAFLEQLFGGPPAAHPAAWQAVSLLRLAPAGGGLWSGADHMAMNLDRVPTLIAYARDDTIAYLPGQSAALAALLRARGAPVVEWAFRGFQPAHSWSLVPAHSICNFLQWHRLVREPAGRVEILSDGEAPFYGLRVDPEGSAVLARVDMILDRAAREAHLLESSGVGALELDLGAAGFTAAGDLEIEHTTRDGSADRLRLRGWQPAPARVLRDEQPFLGWGYDPAGLLELASTGGHRFTLERDAFELELAISPALRRAEPVAFELRGGAAASPWFLLLADRFAEFPLGALAPGDPRWLRVDPSAPTAILLGIPTGGPARLEFGIPDDPALRGLSLHAQALVPRAGAVVEVELSNPLASAPIL